MADRFLISPVLYRILYGSSSTSLNMAKTWQPENAGPRLFNNKTLNRSVIFKFPYFGNKEVAMSAPQGDQINLAAINRPTETGIYIPDNHQRLGNGGYAIYIRQMNDAQALAEHLGIDISKATAADKVDLQMLEILDGLPSLDPFLLKLRFDQMGLSFSPDLIHVTPEEELKVRRIVNSRFEAIIRKAFDVETSNEGTKVLMILNGIWKPGSPESKLLPTAFGIHEQQSDEVMFAIKGFGFYEYLFASALPQAQKVSLYLAEEAVKPTDHAKYSRRELDNLNRLRTEVGKTMQEHHKRSVQIFTAFDHALSSFLNEGDPRPLRLFLTTSVDTFWVLGHCVTALVSAHDVLQDSLNALRPAGVYENIEIVLNRLLATLQPRVPL